MLKDYDETAFADELQAFFTPAQPISKPEHLHGRTAKLQNIRRALNSPGKHVFIYGDRGVGKTSLAKTAAQVHLQQADDLPIVACQTDTVFSQLIEAICVQVVKTNNYTRLRSGDINLSRGSNIQNITPPSIKNINDAVSLIKSVLDVNDRSPSIVIIDEFDQIAADSEKKSVADLIKQLSDQNIDLRLILCGIGKSLDELIGTHLSTDRYLSTIELKTIPHDARWQIITAAADHFRIGIDKDSVVRIGQISDGYPYYVHLIGEKIFWDVYDDPNLVASVLPSHYDRGIKAAIEEAQTSLKQAYDLATQKFGNSEDYEEVLWAVADGHLLQRQVSDIFDHSYKPIMERREGRTLLSKDQFYQRMNKLKQEAHGSVLIGSRTGWYSFAENVLRGYVRLRAERAGVTIGSTIQFTVAAPHPPKADQGATLTLYIALLAALGIGTIVAGVISRWNTISGLRQAWINSLRDEISKFFHELDAFGSLAGSVAKGSTESVQMRKARDDAMASYRQIVLRLNFREVDHRRLDTALMNVMDLKDYKIDESRLLVALITSRRILKQEWDRTKFGPFVSVIKIWRGLRRQIRMRFKSNTHQRRFAKRLVDRKKV